MFKRILSAFFVISSSFFLFSSAQAPRSYTSGEILLQLKKLNTVGSVLYIAAHPDDENTRLIAYLANEKCLRTGYLSLTRGDGGQNLIGPEQGIELGVIRTQELLAARRIDGGEQFFTRAYDFGFSKSPEETLNKWNKDSVLSDMVWIIRKFRPDIIITRFATDGSGGHGHHTTSAILAEEAFDAAADPNRFPEQLQYVKVWKTRRMFHNSTARFFNPNADLSHLIKLDVGGYNALLGKSYGEIAAESRSMHKSQGYGSARQRGESYEYFKPLKGDTAGLKDIFEGIDFTWKRVQGGNKSGSMIAKTIKEFNVEEPKQSLKNLLSIQREFIYNDSYDRQLIQQKLADLNDIILQADGYFYELTGNKFQYSPNESIVLYKQSLFRSSINSGVLQKDSIILNGGREISELYWLRKHLHKDMFQYNFRDPDRKENQQAFLINDGTSLTINNSAPIMVTRPPQYKWVDPEKGELYRPVVITPPVIIELEQRMVTFGKESRKITITLKANKDNTDAVFHVTAPAGWSLKDDPDGSALSDRIVKNVHFEKAASSKAFYIYVYPPLVAPDELSILKCAVETEGKTYTKGIKEIKYDHIPIQTLFPEAEVKLVKLDVTTKSKRIGYIPGAGDEVAPALSQLGYEVITLTDDMIAKEPLNMYDAIITGVRAYNTNDKLASLKPKLMEYVKNGGNMVVQYNTNSFAGPFKADIGPYPFKISRNRITDEEAAVRMLIPEHPVFNTPNKITEKDFYGWIQERSIYHASDWDSNYVAPISMTDPYEMTVGNISPAGKPDNGALIIAKHGKGHFIYTGLVFFRELPAGVPGAYRFMVNLIELGR